jgi:hypothetical protein
MHIASLLLLVTFTSACGPDLSGWKGSWSGSAVINDGRQPEVWPGRLVIGDDARFVATSESRGTPARTFSCAVTAVTATATEATFGAPTACEGSAAPADDCTYRLTFSALTASRTGDELSATGSGRLAMTCPSGSSATDFGLSLSARR